MKIVLGLLLIALSVFVETASAGEGEVVAYALSDLQPYVSAEDGSWGNVQQHMQGAFLLRSGAKNLGFNEASSTLISVLGYTAWEYLVNEHANPNEIPLSLMFDVGEAQLAVSTMGSGDFMISFRKTFGSRQHTGFSLK